jgi:hypothetical protein
MSNDTSTDLDFLTADFADLPIAAAYRIPPSGFYTFSVTAEFGQSKKGNAMITASYKVLEVTQVADAAEADQVVVDDKFQSYFTWDNKWGLQSLQEFLGPFVKHFGTGKLQELVVSEQNPNAYIKEVVFVAKLKRTPRKDKDTKAIIDGEYNFKFSDVTVA